MVTMIMSLIMTVVAASNCCGVRVSGGSDI